MAGEGERSLTGSSEGGRAPAGSGEGGRAPAGSGEGGRAPAGSGEGGQDLLRSLDYPCTARLRLRRLLAYHRRYSYEIYEVARDNTRVIFDVRSFVKNVKFGQWRKASMYVIHFVGVDSRTYSYECNLLLGFIKDLMVLNDFADGYTAVATLVSKWFVSIYGSPALAAYPCFATLVTDVLFLRSDHARAFLKWQLVKNKAAEMVDEMAYNMPELKDKLHFPQGPSNLYHVAPLGSSFHRRRMVKNLARQQSIDLALFYLQLKKRLPSSIQGGSTVFPAGSATIQEEPLIALLEKALQAGRRSLLEQVHPPEYPSKEGFPLMQMLTRPPYLVETVRGQVVQDIPQSSAVVVSRETNSAMNRMSFEESHQDAAHPGNDSKRQRTTGKFGEDPSSSVNASYLPVTYQRSA